MNEQKSNLIDKDNSIELDFSNEKKNFNTKNLIR